MATLLAGRAKALAAARTDPDIDTDPGAE